VNANLACDVHVSQRTREENELLLWLLLVSSSPADDHHLRPTHLQLYAVPAGFEYPSCNLSFIPLLQVSPFIRSTVREQGLGLFLYNFIR
jgi:hypothetical protein